jgi:hypothetical protein
MRPLVEGNSRYGTHKETDSLVEGPTLLPKNPSHIDTVKKNLATLKAPNEAKTNKTKSKYPNISATTKSCRSSEAKSYAEPGLIQLRDSAYHHHLHQLVDNNHSKIEVATMFNPSRRRKKAVKNELGMILNKVTSAVPFTPCFEHSL